MMPQINYEELSRIDFWLDDAEEDENINNYFSDFWNFREQLLKKEYLVLWRKGAGKTALRKTFSKHAKNKYPTETFVREIALSDLPNKKDIFSDNGDISYLWKFVILIEIIKSLIEDESINIETRSNFRDFLKENGYFIDNSSDLIRRIVLKSHIIITSIANKLWLKLETSNGISETRYPKILPELEKLVVESLNSSNSYYFLFDRLDDDYNTIVKSENYLNAISYFIKQVREINTLFKKYWKKAKMIIFLRKDIFENLLLKKIGDANKLDEYKLEINWGEWEQTAANNNLRKMLELRSNFAWIKEIPIDESTISYIIDRTFFRPRDVLKFCKTLQRNKDLNKAEEEYSNWFKNEILDEISVELPSIDKIYDVLKRIWYQIFSKEEFNDRFSDIQISETPEFILKTLYKFGVIGNYDEESSYVNFSYRNPGDIDLRKKFIIHRWLHSTLKLKNSHKYNPIEWPVFKRSSRTN